jgi:hypothetical protein
VCSWLHLIVLLLQQFIHRLAQSLKGTYLVILMCIICVFSLLIITYSIRSNEIIWIATAYMLSYTALQPLCKQVKEFDMEYSNRSYN